LAQLVEIHKSLTAKHPKDAKEGTKRKSFTAKDAKDAKVTLQKA
jgi:hypothetical protein